jgi:2-hydroxychromene-2-carboxylate isomerase
MLELWFDFSCPYAYLASRRARTLPCAIDWRPMLLGGVFRGIGAGDGPMATISHPKQAHNYHDMHRWADLFGEPFRMPPAHPMRTVLALRTLLALPRAWWPAAIEALFAAYWQRGEDVSNPEIIGRALRAAAVTEDTIAAATQRADAPEIKEELRRRTDEAISLGIFGAPAWILRDPPEPPLLIWGQDRIAWVEAALAGWKLSGPPPGGPRAFTAPGPGLAGSTLDVYFDVASPFAYLGLTLLAPLAQAMPPGVQPRLVPILLGALFRDIGQANVPWFAMPAAKQRYVGLEMQRWASWWGVPFDQPHKFPQRTIAAQRLCVLAADDGFELGLGVAAALARAMWAEQRDLEDPGSLRVIVDATAGVPAGWAERAPARTPEPEVKAQLAANTTAAREAGVFGVPTFVVNGKHLFWGQDRLELVARALAGWAVPEPGPPRAPSVESSSR